MLTRMIAFGLMASAAAVASAHEPSPRVQTTSSLPLIARDAAATVDAFHQALRRGDTNAALRLLTEDALIFESGGVERSKAEYAAHHLQADAEFSKAVPSARSRRAGGASGALAWIASEGRTTGTFRGKAVDRMTAETMLLRRVGRGWRIAHIHWSSAAAPVAGVASSIPLLASSTPANGAVVSGPLNSLELRFAPPARLLEVTITGPDGAMPMMVTAAGENAHYALPLSGLGPGAYTVDWRARAGSRDERGTIAFRVR